MGDGMARNDIRFGQAGQADFSQANAMFRISQEQLNNALATGKSTLDEINKAVTANNDAKIKQFINSFGKDELEANRDTINKFIQDVGLHSGNMYSRNEIEEYHDKRMNDLIARDNSQMLNKEKALQHENILANHEADNLVAGITSLLNDPNKTEVQRQKVIDDMIAEARLKGISDKAVAYASNGAYDVWQSALKDINGIITGDNNISNSHYERISGANDAYAQNIGNAQVELENIHANKNNYPSTDIYNQAVTDTTNKIAQLEKDYQDFVKSNPQVHHGTLVGNFNKGLLSFWDKIDKKKQQMWENQFKEAELRRKIKADSNDFTLGMTNTGISQQNADSNTYRALNGGSGGGKSEAPKSGNEIFDKNYGKSVMNQSKDGSWHYDLPSMAKRLGARALSRYNDRLREDITKQQSYSDYYASVQDQIKASSNAEGDNNITQIWGGKNRAGQLDDYLQKETSLTDEQKIELMKGLINNRWSFNKYYNWGDEDKLATSVTNFLEEVNRDIEANNKKLSDSEFREEVLAVAHGMGISTADVVRQLAPYWTDEVKERVPAEWQSLLPQKVDNPFYASDSSQTAWRLFTPNYQTKPQATTSNTSKGKTPSQVAWDMFKPNRNDYGTGTMLIDPRYRK